MVGTDGVESGVLGAKVQHVALRSALVLHLKGSMSTNLAGL
jgi:hypothetical protein